MQFGSSNTAVFFKMRVAGVLHIFQFETKQVSFVAFITIHPYGVWEFQPFMCFCYYVF